MWIPRETVDAIGEGRGLWPYESYRDVAHPDHQNLVTDAACATGKRSVYIATG